MPRIAKHSKSDLADLLQPVFQAYGYDGASLSMLSDAADVSKASLYHHFPNGKEDMAAAVLLRSGARLQRLILAPLQNGDAPEDSLTRCFDGVKQYYTGDVPTCLMNSFLLGQGADRFGLQISAAVAAWQAEMAKAYGALSETGKAQASGAGCLAAHEKAATHKANSVLQQIQGALVLCRVTNSRAPLKRCLSDLQAELS